MQNKAQNQIFCHFLKLGSLVFLEIAAQNQVFCNFLKFGSLVFIEIAYNDSLQQCTTSSRGTTYDKKF